jgi:PAS domain S-box-containing protein
VAIRAAGELERLTAERLMHESNARYRTLIEWSPEPLGVHRNGKIVYVNPAALKMLGVPLGEDLVGKPILELVHPDFHQIVLARAKLMASGSGSQPVMAEKFLKLDGSVIDVEVQSTSIVYDGEPAVQVAMRDITERKHAEEAKALLETQLRQSQKMEAIGTLAGGIAHDFNNILATILGNVDLAREDVSANSLALESLEEIRKASSRARDLVQQILSFSRRQPTARKQILLGPIVEESVRLLRGAMPARLKLDVYCAADVPPVLADATQIEQVLINLATNAMQAIGSGGGHIGICLDTVLLDAAWECAHPGPNPLRALYDKRPGCTVRLSVRDNGPGMDAATLSRIFEPFFTTKPVDEGTGLGLAVVHGIVQTHEGAILVESQQGAGSAFTIYLPIAVGPMTELAFAVSVRSSSSPADQHILYIDDDEALVFLLQRLLQRRGYRVSGYTDQREALDALRADPTSFDLVVTDYNMPGMSGLDVAHAVRAIRADLTVAIASGFIDEALHAEAEGVGVRELIFKANAVEDLCDAFVRLAHTVAVTPKPPPP